MTATAVKMGGSLKGNRKMGRGNVKPEKGFNGELGAHLKDLRLKAGKTVAEVAGKLKVTVQAVYYYERGVNDMPVSLLPRYAEALGVSLRQMLPGK